MKLEHVIPIKKSITFERTICQSGCGALSDGPNCTPEPSCIDIWIARERSSSPSPVRSITDDEGCGAIAVLLPSEYLGSGVVLCCDSQTLVSPLSPANSASTAFSMSPLCFRKILLAVWVSTFPIWARSSPLVTSTLSSSDESCISVRCCCWVAGEMILRSYVSAKAKLGRLELYGSRCSSEKVGPWFGLYDLNSGFLPNVVNLKSSPRTKSE